MAEFKEEIHARLFGECWDKDTVHVNLCDRHNALHTHFGWQRYILDNTPVLGHYTACDYAGATCKSPASHSWLHHNDGCKPTTRTVTSAPEN